MMESKHFYNDGHDHNIYHLNLLMKQCTAGTILQKTKKTFQHPPCLKARTIANLFLHPGQKKKAGLGFSFGCENVSINIFKHPL